MKRFRGARGFVLAAMAATLAGCAPAYHRYEGCRIPCNYCAPYPLPHQLYDGCPCHSRAAEPYLYAASAPLENPLEPMDLGDTDEAAP